MIEDGVKIVKIHYGFGEVVNADQSEGGFVNLTLSSQREKEGSCVKKPKVPLFLKGHIEPLHKPYPPDG